MEPDTQLGVLLDLAESAGIDIRRAPGGGDSTGHPGGALVTLRGREMLFLDPTACVADQINAVAGALAGRAEIKNRFLPPEIRDLIDRAASEG